MYCLHTKLELRDQQLIYALVITYYFLLYRHTISASCLVVRVYRTRNFHVASSSLARAIEQAANPQCAQSNSASYPQRDGK